MSQDERDRAIMDAPNSDPTGGGPPPAGSVTRVTSDGQGVTQGAASDQEADERSAVSTGPNARARDVSISSSAPGLPDDTSQPVEIDPAEERAIERAIREL